MADIVNSLFGLSPQKIKQQQFENDLAMARLYAQDPRAGDRMLGFQAGAGLGRGILGGLGFEDPELKRARELEEVLLETQQQVGEADFSNPAVLYPTLAENLKKRGYGREATQVLLQGQEAVQNYKLSNAKLATEQAQLEKARQEKLPQLTQLINQRDQAAAAGRDDLVAIYQGKIDMETKKDLTADNAADKAILADFIEKLGPTQGALAYDQYKASQKKEISAAQGTGVVNQEGQPVGSYDDKGNFRTKEGRVISKENMNEFGQANEASTKLLSIFDNITPQDIDSAFGTIDVTQNPALTLVADPTVVAAQSKINSAGVRDVLNNLQDLKGASTDMEMRKMASTFPGYTAKPKVMKQWLARARATTLDFLNRQKNKYGFDAPEVNIATVASDPLFSELSEQERSNLVDRLARWDRNFLALPEKERIKTLAEVTKSSANIDGEITSFRGGKEVKQNNRKTVNGVTYEFDGRGWKPVGK